MHTVQDQKYQCVYYGEQRRYRSPVKFLMPLCVYYGEQRRTFAHSFLLELKLEVEVLGYRVNICAPVSAHRLSCTPITYKRGSRFTFCQRLVLSVLFIPAILVGFSGIFIS